MYYTRNQVPEETANKHCANSGETAIFFMIDLLFSYAPWMQTEEHKIGAGEMEMKIPIYFLPDFKAKNL